MNSDHILKKLENDIRTGLKKNIYGTPSFVIDGNVYTGHIPPNILKQIFND